MLDHPLIIRKSSQLLAHLNLNPRASFVISRHSRNEAVAETEHMTHSSGMATKGHRPQALRFSSPRNWMKVATLSTGDGAIQRPKHSGTPNPNLAQLPIVR